MPPFLGFLDAYYTVFPHKNPPQEQGEKTQFLFIFTQ